MMSFKTSIAIVMAFILCFFVSTEPVFALTCNTTNQYTVTSISGSITNYDDAEWPIKPATNVKISDPFGSRTLTENPSNYDFHRGLDLQQAKGTEVYAIADGNVTRVQSNCCTQSQSGCTNPSSSSNCPFPGGGNVVVIEHSLASNNKFELNGQSFSKYYSVYLHLDNFNKDNQGTQLTTGTINKGDRIGSVGEVDANYPHLHLETRVGTTCSGESQSNPNSTCYRTPAFDPSVNPLYFLGHVDVNGVYSNNNNYEVCVTQSPNLQVTFESLRDELDFNEIEVIYPGGTKKINFSNKAGLNLTNLDQNPYDSVTITPSDFKSNTPQYTIQFSFANITDFREINVRDIWGNGKKIVPVP